jgi:hypothetical protein
MLEAVAFFAEPSVPAAARSSATSESTGESSFDCRQPVHMRCVALAG